jgi:hypothetical protein
MTLYVRHSQAVRGAGLRANGNGNCNGRDSPKTQKPAAPAGAKAMTGTAFSTAAWVPTSSSSRPQLGRHSIAHAALSIRPAGARTYPCSGANGP